MLHHFFFPPAELADRSSNAAISETRCKEPEHSSSNVPHPPEHPAVPQDTSPRKLQAHSREGSKSTGEVCTKKDKILLGRKMRHHSNDGQAEGNAGAEGARAWTCLKPAGPGALPPKAVCWGGWELPQVCQGFQPPLPSRAH